MSERHLELQASDRRASCPPPLPVSHLKGQWQHHPWALHATNLLFLFSPRLHSAHQQVLLALPVCLPVSPPMPLLIQTSILFHLDCHGCLLADLPVPMLPLSPSPTPHSPTIFPPKMLWLPAKVIFLEMPIGWFFFAAQKPAGLARCGHLTACVTSHSLAPATLPTLLLRSHATLCITLPSSRNCLVLSRQLGSTLNISDSLKYLT